MALAVWTDSTGVIIDGTGVLLSEECCCGDTVTCEDACIDSNAPFEYDITFPADTFLDLPSGCGDVLNGSTYRVQHVSSDAAECIWRYDFPDYNGTTQPLHHILWTITTGGATSVALCYNSGCTVFHSWSTSVGATPFDCFFVGLTQEFASDAGIPPCVLEIPLQDVIVDAV